MSAIKVSANPAGAVWKRQAVNSTAGHPSVRAVLGDAAWRRLPPRVQARFADDVVSAVYEGTFEVVRASFAGKLLAQLCRLIRSPIAPQTGVNVPATVRVFANQLGGMVWEREYRFAGKTSIVSSVKQFDDRGEFVEALPMGLRMPLDVFERDGVLHFRSRAYRFDWGGIRIPIPHVWPPGETHVEHTDLGNGLFRFTLTVTHRWLGEVFYQTGIFRDAG